MALVLCRARLVGLIASFYGEQITTQIVDRRLRLDSSCIFVNVPKLYDL